MNINDVVFLDLESRSMVDLRKTGSWVYAEDPTTSVWVASFAIGEGPVQRWFPGDPFPADIGGVLERGGFISAHNFGGFEWPMWRCILTPRHGWPELRYEQGHCTMAEASAMALPRSLEDVGAALGLEIQKDKEGQALMLRLARPRRVEADGTPIWWSDPERIERLAQYCDQDVIVARDVFKKLRRLSPNERVIWELDGRINTRGVRVDLQLVRALREMVFSEKARLDFEMRQATGGKVSGTTKVKELVAMLKEQGIDVASVDKAAMRELLGSEIADDVRTVLELRREAAKSSTAKLNALEQRTSSDGRMRNNLLYHGAATGRWSGSGAQLQNLPRAAIDGDIEDAVALVLDYGAVGVRKLHGSAMETASALLRPCITAAPGHVLVAADYSAIEARVLAWVANEQAVLDVFRTGADIYCHAASGIYGREITKKDKDERQIGKVSTLALGYQGGVKAFQKMAAIYGISIEDAKAEEIKNAWREANANITAFWKGCEKAALAAAADPGRLASVGAVQFQKAGRHLWCRLPSGRQLCYPYARVETVETPFGGKETVTSMTVNSVTRKWERRASYGGLYTENIVQAISRDVMAVAMWKVESAGYPVVLSCHDELVAEIPIGSVSMVDFERRMCDLPKWAEGLPVAAEGWEGARYRK